MNENPSQPGATGPGLKRVLHLPSLVLYGIILIQPTAPMPLYGAAATLGKGHVVTTILIGMFAMLFTAISYGRMANVYPSAGSAYAYVSRAIHPGMGVLCWMGYDIRLRYESDNLCYLGQQGCDEFCSGNTIWSIRGRLFHIVYCYELTGY